jgi:hypothetical protein
VAAADYSSTSARSRSLWLEFERPPEDPQDSFFARVLHYGVDVLLALTPAALEDPPDPPLGVDPEPIRVITPGQSIDAAGLDAMVRLIPSTHSDRHYLLPLPPGMTEDSPELFGFWTYEIRTGHHLDPATGELLWSTAQARFGRPLRVAGIQHSAPLLTCVALRVRGGDQDDIVVTAPFATPVLKGQRLTNIGTRGEPKTEMWFVVYAQIARADNAQMLNVLIARRQGVFDRERQSNSLRDFYAIGMFANQEIQGRLRGMALPEDSPLSVLAVELLPGGNPEKTVDPLGRHLGDRRILRVSPLAAVEATC